MARKFIDNQPSVSAADEQEYLELCKQPRIPGRDGGKLAAVKLYQERTGCGLVEARDYIEQLCVKNGLTSADASPSPAGVAGTGEPRRSSPFSVWLMVGVALIFLLWWLLHS
ncbi:MAG: hypothetical protein IJ710_05125 [Prevotella sp.]|nr:hypothetical protein [Prevotella sp.]